MRRTKLLSTLSAAAAVPLILSSFAGAATNLVTNGDFSNGLTGWTIDGDAASPVVVVIDQGSAVITNQATNAGNSYLGIHQCIPIQGAQQYHVQFEAFVATDQPDEGVAMFSAHPSSSPTCTGPLLFGGNSAWYDDSLRGTWQAKTIDVSTPANAVALFVRAVAGKESQGTVPDFTVRFDNISVTLVEPDDPTPPADDPTPPADDPTPPADDPTPPADDPTPPADDPTPPADDPTPPADDPTPPADDPTPPADDPTPPADDPTPPADDPTPPADDPTPPADDPTPPVDDPAPPADDPTPPADDPTPPADDPTPPADGPTPPADDPTLPADDPTPPADDPQGPPAAGSTPAVDGPQEPPANDPEPSSADPGVTQSQPETPTASVGESTPTPTATAVAPAAPDTGSGLAEPPGGRWELMAAFAALGLSLIVTVATALSAAGARMKRR